MTQTLIVAKVLLKNPKGEVLILRRSKTDQRRPGEGDLAGGWMDEGEDFITAAVRETKEEAGIEIKPEDLQLVYAKTDMRGEKNVCWLFFIAETEETEVTLSSEHDKSEWMSLDKAVDSLEYDIQKNFLIYVRDHGLL